MFVELTYMLVKLQDQLSKCHHGTCHDGRPPVGSSQTWGCLISAAFLAAVAVIWVRCLLCFGDFRSVSVDFCCIVGDVCCDLDDFGSVFGDLCCIFGRFVLRCVLVYVCCGLGDFGLCVW